MLTRLEVRHQLSGDETTTYEFSLLFNLPEIPGQLASMVKAPSNSSLRVFPSQDTVAKLNVLGDRLERKEEIPYKRACGGYRVHIGYTIL